MKNTAEDCKLHKEIQRNTKECKGRQRNAKERKGTQGNKKSPKINIKGGSAVYLLALISKVRMETS